MTGKKNQCFLLCIDWIGSCYVTTNQYLNIKCWLSALNKTHPFLCIISYCSCSNYHNGQDYFCQPSFLEHALSLTWPPPPSSPAVIRLPMGDTCQWEQQNHSFTGELKVQYDVENLEHNVLFPCFGRPHPLINFPVDYSSLHEDFTKLLQYMCMMIALFNCL